MKMEGFYARYFRMKSRIAQLKIQETAFMLLALALLFVLIFIFYSNMEMQQFYAATNKLKAEEALSMLEKIAAMPEFSCLKGTCIDYDKVTAIKNVSGYDALWRSLNSIQIMTIYPEKSLITVYDKGGKNTVGYSAYFPLCKTKYREGYIWQDCDLAKLIVSFEELKQK